MVGGDRAGRVRPMAGRGDGALDGGQALPGLRGGAMPVEPRTTSSGGRRTPSAGCGWPLISSTRARTAATAIAATGWRTRGQRRVGEGDQRRVVVPTTETSPGTRRPRARAARIAPSAIRSRAADHAGDAAVEQPAGGGGAPLHTEQRQLDQRVELARAVPSRRASRPGSRPACAAPAGTGPVRRSGRCAGGRARPGATRPARPATRSSQETKGASRPATKPLISTIGSGRAISWR